jgi:hypothetical protein
MTNWKTTLFGWLAGAATLGGNMYQSGHFSWAAFGASVALGILGTVAQDSKIQQ